MSMCSKLISAVVLASATLVSGQAIADAKISPGIVTSFSRSAIIPTSGMPPGSEMWAIWISLPAGKKIEVTEPKVQSTWMDLDMGLTGSTVSGALPGKAPEHRCTVFRAEGQVRYTGQETSTGPGDGFACPFGTGSPYWEENRGSDVYSRAQLNVGGPWVPGSYSTVDDYRNAGGDTKALRVDAVSFRKVADELRAAGMMAAMTRVIVMPPGSTSTVTDRYPTVRMVTRGELKWSTVPIDAGQQAMAKGMFKLGQFNWADWTKPQQVVLSNETDEPAELVEWSVAPASGPAP